MSRTYRIPPDVPEHIIARLGLVVDAEIADEFQVHPETVRRWRLALGIAPRRKWRETTVKRTRRNYTTIVGRWARGHDVAFTALDAADSLGVIPSKIGPFISAAFNNGEIVRVKGSRNRLWITA